MNRRWVGLGVALLALDQASKALVRAEVAEGSVRSLLPGVDLVHTRNPGVSFGFLSGAPTWVVATVSTLALLVVVGVVARTVAGPIGGIAIAAIVAGAVGNLVDRLARGHVTDFLDLPLIPPCNVADIAITAGALLVAIGAWRAPVDAATPEHASAREDATV